MSQTHPYKEPCFTAIIDGLTKRELFAGLAMMGCAHIVASVEAPRVAAAAREFADALIAELAK